MTLLFFIIQEEGLSGSEVDWTRPTLESVSYRFGRRLIQIKNIRKNRKEKKNYDWISAPIIQLS